MVIILYMSCKPISLILLTLYIALQMCESFKSVYVVNL